MTRTLLVPPVVSHTGYSSVRHNVDFYSLYAHKTLSVQAKETLVGWGLHWLPHIRTFWCVFSRFPSYDLEFLFSCSFWGR